MTGLMYNKPEDHIGYMLNCLGRVQEKKGTNGVKWNTFVEEVNRTSPLPPISSDRDRQPTGSTGKDKSGLKIHRAKGD